MTGSFDQGWKGKETLSLGDPTAVDGGRVNSSGRRFFSKSAFFFGGGGAEKFACSVYFC